MTGAGSTQSVPGRARSSIGTMIGGSATIRSSPSTKSARRASTRVLSRERAFATMSSWARASRLLTRLTATSWRTSLSSSPASRCSYHACSPPIPAARRMRSRYSRRPAMTIARRSAAREPAVAAHDLEAGREPLDVPLPRTGQRLVEVVDVEQHPPLRGAEQAEVRQVGVAAQLHRDAGPGGVGQVGGHDGSGAPEERERRYEHPAVPDRDEFLHPRPGLLLEQRHRVRTVRRRPPFAVAGPRRHPTRRTAARDPVLGGQPLAPPRRREILLGSGHIVRHRCRVRARTNGHDASAPARQPDRGGRCRADWTPSFEPIRVLGSSELGERCAAGPAGCLAATPRARVAPRSQRCRSPGSRPHAPQGSRHVTRRPERFPSDVWRSRVRAAAATPPSPQASWAGC